MTYSNGAALRLKDIATLSEAPENQYLSAWANNKPAIIISVQRQPGANVISVVDCYQDAAAKIAGRVAGLHQSYCAF